MSLRPALLALALAASGCAAGQAVIDVKLDATPPITGIATVKLTLSIAGQSRELTWSPPAPGTTPLQVALLVDKDHTGAFTLSATALDGKGAPLGSGMAPGTVSPSHTTAVTILLSGAAPGDMSAGDATTGGDTGAPTGDGAPDLAADLGSGGDDAATPGGDIAAPPGSDLAMTPPDLPGADQAMPALPDGGILCVYDDPQSLYDDCIVSGP